MRRSLTTHRDRQVNILSPGPSHIKKGRRTMNDVLKGNFTTKKKVAAKDEGDDLEARFEREALKHLGGSIAFVAKKKVKWDAGD